MPTVLVTGSNRGLGLEFVRQYLAEGWRVLACARNPSTELEALAANNEALTYHRLEIADHDCIDELAAALTDIPIDVLLLSAGTMGGVDFATKGLSVGGFGDSDFPDWEHVIRVNTLGPMKMSEAFVNHVQASEQRKIVALSSMVASMQINTAGGLYAYRASKAALNAVMRSLSVDLADRKIIALPLHPGWAKTDMGGAQAPVSPAESVSGMRRVIAGLSLEQSGRFLCYDGTEMPW
jgi:NAD(P)-dependent dehydrogenase (short-subunit alcohol dehydrogenase family)